MTTEEIITLMHKFIIEKYPDVTREQLKEVGLTDILVTSFEVVEFAMEMEESLGLEEEALDLTELWPKFRTATFSELAKELLAIREGTPC